MAVAFADDQSIPCPRLLPMVMREIQIPNFLYGVLTSTPSDQPRTVQPQIGNLDNRFVSGYCPKRSDNSNCPQEVSSTISRAARRDTEFV
jgi:hypothetical protein